jgi:branched-chain amino acid transport system ATP-binding protein
VNAILRLEDVRTDIAQYHILHGVGFEVQEGGVHVLLGRNGAGKTTWFNLVSGQLAPSSGRIVKGESDITRLSPSARAKAGIGRAFQLTNLFPALTVRENVRLAVQARAGMGSSLFRRAAALSRLREEADAILERTRLSEVAALPASVLPHGDQRKLEVALLVAMKPDIFMFDEPTAGMSVDEAPAILELIADIRKDASKTVLLVEHKMDVVRALADRIVVLNNGALVADGAPGEVMALPLVRQIYLGVGEEKVA